MKITKTLFVFFLVVLIYVGYENTVQREQVLPGIEIGKNLTITISESECIDAEYLQKVLNGQIENDVHNFDIWNEKELKKLADYMEQNGYVIVPGQYTLNQAWRFENGMFVLNGGDKREVFEFSKTN